MPATKQDAPTKALIPILKVDSPSKTELCIDWITQTSLETRGKFGLVQEDSGIRDFSGHEFFGSSVPCPFDNHGIHAMDFVQIMDALKIGLLLLAVIAISGVALGVYGQSLFP